MRTKSLVGLMILGGLLAANPALGQGSPGGDKGTKADSSKQAAPSGLEDLLAKALKQNPDILVAQAKVYEAEAELNRAQQHVLAKIVVLHAEIDAARAISREADLRWARMKELVTHAKAIISDEEYGTAQTTMYKYKAELARKEAELALLIGKKLAGADNIGKPLVPDLGVPIEVIKGRITTIDLKAPIAEKIRAALETEIKADFANLTLEDALRYLKSKIKGVNLVLAPMQARPIPMIKENLAEPVSLLAALQMLEDAYDIRFIVREYGIVGLTVTSVPNNALSVSEFARQAAKKTEK